MILLSSLISALVMWFTIWLLMRREGVVSLKPVLLICLAIILITLFALKFLGAWGMVPVIICLVLALVHWCFLSWPKAILVAAVWLLSQIAFGTFVKPIF